MDVKQTYHIHSAPLEDGTRATVGAVVTKDNTLRFGIAVCAPGDNFVRRTGADKSLGRALIGTVPNRLGVVHKASTESVIKEVETPQNSKEMLTFFLNHARDILAERGFQTKNNQKEKV